MKHALKTGAIIFMSIAMLVSFAACKKEKLKTGIPGEVVNVVGEITFTYNVTNDEEKVSPDAFVRAFEKMYPDAKVNKNYSAGDIVARIASGDIGDVFHFPEEHTYTYAVTHQALMPLDAYLKPLNIDPDQVYSGIYDLGQVGGRLFMASRDYNHIVLFTNVTALEEEGLSLPEEGWTWEDFLIDYAPKLTKLDDDGKTYTQLAMNLPLEYDPIYIPFLEGWGGQWYDEVNKKINLYSDPQVLAGVQAMMDAVKDGYLYPSQKSDTSAYKNLSPQNYVFRHMVYPGLFQLGTSYDRLGIEWDIASFPHFPSPKVGTGSSGYGVYNRTKRPDTAAAFALFFFTEEGQKAFNGQTGGSVPLMKSLADDDFWRGKGTEWENKNYDAFVSFPNADTVGQVQCRVPAPVATKIDGGPWASMLRMHFDGSQDFKDGLKKIEQTANEVWEKLADEVIGK